MMKPIDNSAGQSADNPPKQPPVPAWKDAEFLTMVILVVIILLLFSLTSFYP